MSEITKVIFRKFDGEVTALFPEVPVTTDPDLCSCYSHIGQHSTASYWYVFSKSKPATEEEASSLKTELEQLGYKLMVCRRTPKDACRKREDVIKEWSASAETV